MSSAEGGQVPLHVVAEAARPADWEAVYREHVSALFRYVYGRVGNRPDAEDVTSAVFMRALPRLDGQVSSLETGAYLRATARSVLADLWRGRHGVRTDLLDEQRVSAPARESREVDVEALLASLPSHYRQVLELRFLRGYSIKETASAMGISVSNAKVMQLRALRRAASGNHVPS